MTTPGHPHTTEPPALLLMARRWAETAGAPTTLEDEDGGSGGAAGELALLLRFLDVVNPFEDAARVAWLSGHQRHAATVRHRITSNEWLLQVDSSHGAGHSVRASSAEIGTPVALPGHHVAGEETGEAWPVLIEVCVDSAEENIVSELALAADHVLPDRWNGWARPIATAAALADFLRRWRHNDPNGVWGEAFELQDRLVCTRSDEDYEDSFPLVGGNSAGLRLYDLSGWVWVELPDIAGSTGGHPHL